MALLRVFFARVVRARLCRVGSLLQVPNRRTKHERLARSLFGGLPRGGHENHLRCVCSIRLTALLPFIFRGCLRREEE